MTQDNRAARLLPALALVWNAFVWGVSWWPFRALQDAGLHPLWATAAVYVVAMIVLLAVRPGALRAFAHEPLLWLLLVAAGMTNVGFNWAVTVGDVVRVVLLFYLMPAWTVVLAWLLLGERPSGGSLARLLLALAGVVVVLKRPGAAWPVPDSLADWLAIVGGFSFALTNVLLRKLGQVDPPSRIFAMFAGGAVLAAATALLGLHTGLVPPVPGPQWRMLMLTGLLSLSFLSGNMALQYGAARLDAHTAALIMLAEVVFASFSSVALGAATMTTRTLAGGAMIIVAAAWSALPQARAESRA